MAIVKSKKLRDSAKGRDCTLNIAGVCTYNPETTVLCHFPSDIAGYKSTDISAGFGCSSCHAVIDDRSKLSAEDFEFYCRRSQTRTMQFWIDNGYISVKGAA